MLPQIIYLVLLVFGSGVTLALGDKRKVQPLWAVFLGQAITLAILYWGGFFDCFQSIKL